MTTTDGSTGETELNALGVGRALGVLGLLAVLGGLVTILQPSIASDTAFGYGFVTLLGVVILAASLRYWVGLALTTVESATPPPVEERREISIPGVAFDRTLADHRLTAVSRLRARRDVLDRLRSVAARIHERDHGGSDGQPDADVFGEDAETVLFDDADREQGLTGRLAAVRAKGTPLQRRVSDVVAELARQYDGERVSVEFDVPERTTATRPSAPGLRATNRFRLLKPMALSAVGVGVVFGSAALLLVGALFGGVAVYAAADSPPTAAVRVTRSVETDQPAPGEPVRVTVSIENTGDRLLPDLTVIDRVPEGCSVTAGSPRHGTSLRAGATATFGYELEAVRGHHEFGDAAVIVRNLSGSFERVADVSADGDASITYDVTAVTDHSIPLRKQTSRSVGRVVTDVGGSGIELHSVREYRTGDPLNRIDWNRAAAGEDLATLQFREERSATVVLLVDARVEAYVAPEADAPSAVDRSVLAAAESASALLAADDQVGLAALSPRTCWIAPSSGHAHRTRIHEQLANAEAFDPRPPDRSFKPAIRLQSIRKRLPSAAQLLVFSPVCDDEVVDVVRRLGASRHATTVISPNATGGRTPGRTLARIERSLRLSRLREAGVRVVDWDAEESLALSLDKAGRRWS